MDFGCIQKSIFPTFDSFRLIRSHIQTWFLPVVHKVTGEWPGVVKTTSASIHLSALRVLSPMPSNPNSKHLSFQNLCLFSSTFKILVTRPMLKRNTNFPLPPISETVRKKKKKDPPQGSQETSLKQSQASPGALCTVLKGAHLRYFRVLNIVFFILTFHLLVACLGCLYFQRDSLYLGVLRIWAEMAIMCPQKREFYFSHFLSCLNFGNYSMS